MNLAFLFKCFRFWPPFFGAGIRVKEFNSDFTYVLVQMKMRFWNKNILGTHFGGSLYSMTDPFYVLMLMANLGREYIVWDKTAHIRYRRPGSGTVYARFELKSEQLNHIKEQLKTNNIVEPKFTIKIIDKKGIVVAEVEKILHVKRRAEIHSG